MKPITPNDRDLQITALASVFTSQMMHDISVTCLRLEESKAVTPDMREPIMWAALVLLIVKMFEHRPEDLEEFITDLRNLKADVDNFQRPPQ